MRSAAEALRPPAWPLALAGGVAAAVVAVLTAGALARVAWAAPGWAAWTPADTAALRFTLVQAGLSALVSVGLAIPVARALARRAFPGRAALILMLGAPFVLPALVAVAGLLAVFGRAGLVNQGLAALGLPLFSPYGLHGVVLAQTFFNLPLAVRLILQGWQRIPAEHLRLAAALSLGPWARFRWIEAPMLAQIVPGALALVALLGLTSFAVALTLGGGPAATTLELAIWQAFRFDFDLGRAAMLGVVQTGLGLAALALLALAWRPVLDDAGRGRAAPARGPGGAAKAWDAAWISLAAAFLALPLAMVALRGAPHVLTLPASVWAAAGRSLVLAALTLALLAPLALALILAAARLGRGFEGAGLLGLSSSPLVIGTGLFLWVRPWADPAALALPVAALITATLALPFALRAGLPALRQAQARHARLALALGLGARARWRLIFWPALRRPMGFALGLGAALAVGDLGAIVLFAALGSETLPMELHRLMGAYRTDDAAGAALVLLAFALGVFGLVDRVVGGARDAGA